MKAHLKSANGRLVVEVEGEDSLKLFAAIAQAQEFIDADYACGACGSERIRHQHRIVRAYKYYELHCEACGADLHFGVRQDGSGLFAKRVDAEGHPMPNRGWVTFVKSLPAGQRAATPPQRQGR